MNQIEAVGIVKKGNQALDPTSLEALEGSDSPFHCPMMQFVGLISGKWSIPIIYRLSIIDAPIRFGELLRVLQPITQKELTKHLKNFERHGLVSRTVYPQIPPRVEYQITELGKSLKQPLASLAGWIQQHADQIPHLNDPFDNH